MKSSTFKRILIKNQQIWIECLIRIFLGVLFVYMEKLQPFERKIHQEELWLYKNPSTPSYIPSQTLWPLVFCAPLVGMVVVFLIRREVTDLIQAFFCFTLILGLNGLLTDIIKLTVGRPRPDFFWRCFPDGLSNPDMLCTGDPKIITEGRKSFPSGHSSFSFASLGFISMYFAGKLGVFNSRGRGKSIRLIVSGLPLIVALSVALSRTCDYHHHWQDVLCGSILGLSIAYLCYRQHYPALTSTNSDVPLVQTLSANLEIISAAELPYKVA